MRNTSLPLAGAIGLLALVGAAHVAAIRPGHVWGGDFAMYVLHARNLAEGRPYAQTGYLYNPDYPQVGPPTYPPVAPLLLAPLHAARGLDLEAMKGVMIGSLLVALAAVWAALRDDLPWGYLAALVLLLGLNHFFLDETNVIGSDLPFLAFLYLTMLLVHEGDKRADRPGRRAAWYVAAGLCAYLAYGTRTVGIVIAPAMVLAELLRLRRITLASLGACAVFGALLLFQGMLVHSGGSYFDQLSTDVAALAGNAVGYARQAAAFWRNGYFRPGAAALFLAVTILSLVGYASTVRRGAHFREVFPLLYLGVVALWPSYQGMRMLYPVLPLWLFYAMAALELPCLAARPLLKRGLIVALAGGAIASYAAVLTTRRFGPLEEGVARPESVELFEQVRQRTAPDDVVVFVKPRVMSLLAGRTSSVYHQPAEDAALWDYFERIGAKHFVVLRRDDAMDGYEQPETLAYARDFVARNRDRLEPAWGNDDFTMYRVR